MADEFDELIGPAAEDKTAKGRTPPYIAFRTLLTLLGEFKHNGLPPRIDRSVLSRFAGGLQGQIMLALRSLGLMDGENKPTQRLAHLVEDYETPQFKPRLKVILEEVYPYVFKLDLMTATPSMFSEAFKNNIDAKEEVLRKVRTFFLHAAREVGVPIGPRIEKAKYPRPRVNGTRKPKATKAKDFGDPGVAPRVDPPASSPLMEMLLAKFPDFDPSWSPELKAKWFEGFDQFMKKAATDQ